MRFFLFLLLLCSFVNLSAQQKSYQIGAVGFYNLENLFDTLDTEDVRDTEFTPGGEKAYNTELYRDKLSNLSKVLGEVGTEMTPDGLALVGVAEIENRTVLEDLVKEHPIAERRYQIVHYDSPDKRGIDVGLLYNPKYFQVNKSRNIPLLIYDDGGERKFTRDVLHVEGEFDGEPLHVLVNHWPSRRGGEQRSAPGRNAAALLCKNVVDSLQAISSDVKVIIMGDLNDNPTNDSVMKVLGAKKDKNKVPARGIYNPYINLYKKGGGSNAWRDTWSLFDQVMVTGGLVKGDTRDGWQFYQARIYNKPYLLQKTGRFQGYPFRTFVGDSYLGGYSDHLPAYIFLIKELN